MDSLYKLLMCGKKFVIVLYVKYSMLTSWLFSYLSAVCFTCKTPFWVVNIEYLTMKHILQQEYS